MEAKRKNVQSFRELLVWQRAMALAKAVYIVTRHLPKEELYGLSAQLKRCAVSIPSNIAEGSSKRSTREFIRFLNIAYGSLCELETQVQLSTELSLLTDAQTMPLLADASEIGRMMNGLISSLEKKLNSEL